MSLKYPKFESESQEADWLYEHRDLIEADFLIAGSEGRLLRRGSFDAEPTQIWEVAPEDLRAAKKLLHDSGLWVEERMPLQQQSESAAQLKRAS